MELRNLNDLELKVNEVGEGVKKRVDSNPFPLLVLDIFSVRKNLVEVLKNIIYIDADDILFRMTLTYVECGKSLDIKDLDSFLQVHE